MSDNDPEATEENPVGDGQSPPSEKKPETDSDLREEVDLRLEGIFGDLEDDGNEGDEMPPSWTQSNLRAEVDQKLEGLFSDLDEDEAEDVVDGDDATSAPAGAESDSDSIEAVRQAADDDSGDLDDDNEGPGIDEAGDAPVAPTETATPSGPPATGETDQSIDDETIADNDPEIAAGSADAGGSEEKRPPGEAVQSVSDYGDEAGPAVSDAPGNFDNRDDGAGLDQADSAKEPPSAPAEPADSLPDDQPPPVDTAAIPPAEQAARKPLTARIILWGIVLIIITVTVRYLITYEFEELAAIPARSTAQLFHKVGPLPPPAAVPAAAEKTAPQPTTAGPAKAAEPPKADDPSSAAGAKVKAYVPRTYPYAIHVISYRSAAVAQEKVAAYRRGFQAFLVRVDLGKKGIWYRIFFGHFPSATSTVEAIEKYHLTGALVRRTRYACLIGSYPSSEQAAAASRQLSDKGFFPYTITFDNGFHVFVGAHPTLAAAEALSRGLSAKGFSSDLIER